MDEKTKRLIAEANAIADAADRSYENWCYQQRQRERSKESSQVIYKDYSGARPVPPEPASRYMSDADQEVWNSWVDARILDYIEVSLDEWSRGLIRPMLKKLRDEVIDEIGALRADMQIDRAFPRGQVIDLPAFVRKRQSDAA